jgi:hypothetical protein
VTLYVLRLHDVADVPLPSSVFDDGGDSNRSYEPASQLELALAVFQLMSSTGRVMEIYQWASDADHLSAPQEDSKIVGRLRAVTADLLRICELLGIDAGDAANNKLTKNRSKYPIESSRGTSRKYTEIATE